MILSSRVLVWFGLISYPLYLWHWSLLSFAQILESEFPSWKIRAAAVAISIVLAWLTYQLVEKPIRSGKQGKAQAIILAVLMTAVGSAGYYCFEKDGLKFRAAEQVAGLNDFEESPRQRCNAFTGDNYNNDFCNVGTSNISEPHIALIGDSHANAYTSMLTDYGRHDSGFPSYIQFGLALCPPLNDYGPDYCRTFTRKVFDLLSKHDEIKTIILAAEWNDYFVGSANENPLVGKWIRSRWRSHAESAESFKIALQQTIRDYRSIGKNIIVLLTVPEGSNPRSCLIRPVRLTDKNSCNISRKTANEFDGKYRDFMIPLLRSENVPYFDPFEYLCDDKSCKTADGYKILYADDRHISAFGGEYLARKGGRRLKEIFKFDSPR